MIDVLSLGIFLAILSCLVVWFCFHQRKKIREMEGRLLELELRMVVRYEERLTSNEAEINQIQLNHGIVTTQSEVKHDE